MKEANYLCYIVLYSNNIYLDPDEGKPDGGPEIIMQCSGQEQSNFEMLKSDAGEHSYREWRGLVLEDPVPDSYSVIQ